MIRRLLTAALLLAQFTSHAGSLAPACDASARDRAVREQGFVEINGQPQWLTVTGQDCRNPVLLFVHGGPGNPNTPFADALFGAWAKDFTLVQWDQRGAGRSYGRNLPVRELAPAEFDGTPLTLDLLAADGIAVAEHLRRRLGHAKLILTGGSWGAALAVEMAHLRPGLFHAYVGVAQLVGPADLAASHALALQRARELGDQPALDTLQALGAPPWTDPRSFGKLRRILRGYEARRTAPGPAWTPAADHAGPQDAAAYEAGEAFSFLKFVGLQGDGMLWQLDLPGRRTKLALPVFLVQGEEDLLTPAAVTQAWFDRLTAPAKKLVIVHRAGHDPNGPLLDAQWRVLKDAVLPLAR
ncbi:MAG: alpha/beta hydrolase [Roseateles sp.]|uniref:alpha/beta fold hydrolase n=1 Tax=Roseateles sp. TaxID=1971397 RepID=UPI0039E92D21